MRPARRKDPAHDCSVEDRRKSEAVLLATRIASAALRPGRPTRRATVETTTATTVIVEATAATAPEGGRTGWPLRSVRGLIDAQGATLELVTVELLDRLLRLGIARELDECETTRFARGPIVGHEDVDQLSTLSEELLELILRRLETQVSDKQLGSDDSSSESRLAGSQLHRAIRFALSEGVIVYEGPSRYTAADRSAQARSSGFSGQSCFG